MTTPTATTSRSAVVQAIGEAIAAAVAALDDDVQVLDAVDPLQAYAKKSVTVGGTWDPDDEAFVTDQTISVSIEESGAARLRTETTAVECIAYSGSGDEDIPGHRTAVGRMVAAIGAQLLTLNEIDDCAVRARITAEQWAQGGDGKGTLVMAMFTVEAVRLL